MEVGNLRGFQTFVPNQDKRKRFLSRALGEVSTLEKICEFSYEKLVKRARTIDVIWFNERNMPASCFEVEHSTDIYNSLIKFSDLTDFHSNFCIVANYARKREYDQKLSSNIFAKIRERINFMSYEQLSDLHANTFKLRKTTETIAFLGN